MAHLGTRDLSSVLTGVLGLEPVADLAVDTNCASFDRQSAAFANEDEVGILVRVGPAVFTINGSNFLELEVEDSPDDSVFTDVADDRLTRFVAATNTGTFGLADDAAEDALFYHTTYKGPQRYGRVVVGFTGTVTGGIPIAVYYLNATPRDAPTVMPL